MVATPVDTMQRTTAKDVLDTSENGRLPIQTDGRTPCLPQDRSSNPRRVQRIVYAFSCQFASFVVHNPWFPGVGAGSLHHV